MPSCSYWSFAVGLRFLTLLIAVGFLSGCTSFIPGLDRVLFPNSTAKVGPLISKKNETTIDPYAIVAPTQNPGNEVRSVDSQTASVTRVPEKAETSSSPNISSPSVTNAQGVGNEDIPTTRPNPPRIQSDVVNEDIDIPVDYGVVVGKVELRNEEQKTLPPIGTMVTLTPKNMVGSAPDRQPLVHIIDMEEKVYKPRYSLIEAGDQLVFVNKDNIRHNVFSRSGKNAFDLGTYGAGLKRAVTLTESGIVKIYCNIHPEMATFVAVGNLGLSVQTDAQGRYRIEDVLPGLYEVSIWNIRGERTEVVEVKANETTVLKSSIDTSVSWLEPHKNKFGGKYSKNSKLFEDEFY